MKKKYIEDLKEIKDIMNRSSRFISLSGLSGISAGITALIGAYLAYKFVFVGGDYLTFESVYPFYRTILHTVNDSLGDNCCKHWFGNLSNHSRNKKTEAKNLGSADQANSSQLIDPITSRRHHFHDISSSRLCRHCASHDLDFLRYGTS